MFTASTHAILLYAGCGVAVLSALATRRRLGADPPINPYMVLGTCVPYFVLAAIEGLNLGTSGPLVAEPALPCFAALFLVIVTRSAAVVKWGRYALVAFALLMWGDGILLTTRSGGHVMRPPPPALGLQVKSEWYTPLTGMYRTFR